GQTSVSIQCFGTVNSEKGILVTVLEIAGLGPSPGTDVTSNHTQGPASPSKFYQNYADTDGPPPTTQAPELWVAWTGAQQTDSFSINNPASSQGWTIAAGAGTLFLSNGGIHARALCAYQVRTSTGNLNFSGTFSEGVSKGTIGVSYFSSAATV